MPPEVTWSATYEVSTSVRERMVLVLNHDLDESVSVQAAFFSGLF